MDLLFAGAKTVDWDTVEGTWTARRVSDKIHGGSERKRVTGKRTPAGAHTQFDEDRRRNRRSAKKDTDAPPMPAWFPPFEQRTNATIQHYLDNVIGGRLA